MVSPPGGQPQSHGVLCSWWGGGTNFESATWLIGQLLQGQGSFEGFLQNEGVIERENQKKNQKKKKRTVRIQQIFANFPARIQF